MENMYENVSMNTQLSDTGNNKDSFAAKLS